MVFSLDDFPIGSYFYWVRTLNPQDSVAVYTKMKVDEHGEDGNIIVYHTTPKNNQVSMIFEKTKYEVLSNSFFIPEFLYNELHGLPNPPLNEKQKLQTIFLTGHTHQDQIVKMATMSFVEYDTLRKQNKVKYA